MFKNEFVSMIRGVPCSKSNHTSESSGCVRQLLRHAYSTHLAGETLRPHSRTNAPQLEDALEMLFHDSKKS